MKTAFSPVKPWQKMGLAKHQYLSIKPWKKAEMSRERFEALVLSMDQEILDEIWSCVETGGLVDVTLASENVENSFTTYVPKGGGYIRKD